MFETNSRSCDPNSTRRHEVQEEDIHRRGVGEKLIAPATSTDGQKVNLWVSDPPGRQDGTDVDLEGRYGERSKKKAQGGRDCLARMREKRRD